jgi:hypothetical protein
MQLAMYMMHRCKESKDRCKDPESKNLVLERELKERSSLALFTPYLQRWILSLTPSSTWTAFT